MHARDDDEHDRSVVRVHLGAFIGLSLLSPLSLLTVPLLGVFPNPSPAALQAILDRERAKRQVVFDRDGILVLGPAH